MWCQNSQETFQNGISTHFASIFEAWWVQFSMYVDILDMDRITWWIQNPTFSPKQSNITEFVVKHQNLIIFYFFLLLEKSRIFGAVQKKSEKRYVTQQSSWAIMQRCTATKPNIESHVWFQERREHHSDASKLHLVDKKHVIFESSPFEFLRMMVRHIAMYFYRDPGFLQNRPKSCTGVPTRTRRF